MTEDAKREWLAHDTWSVPQGLALLAEVDPARVGEIVPVGDAVLVHSFGLEPAERARVERLARLWHSRPEHASLTRATPARFAEWAKAKGVAPAWLADIVKPAGEPAQPAAKLHKPRRRADPLAAVIVLAERQAADATDWQSVWACLVELAQSRDRPAPLLGYVEGEGVQYQADDPVSPVEYLSREALRQRFKRRG